MSDTIYRQDVINVIEERQYANRTTVALVSEFNRLEGYILRLPSAEPCENTCEITRKSNASDLISRQDALDALEQTQWIPCEERLPEDGNNTYMTTLDYGELGRATGQRFFFGKQLGWEDDAVVAWMSLPKPYEGETK